LKLLEEYLEMHLADIDALYMHAEVCCSLGYFEKALAAQTGYFYLTLKEMMPVS